MAKNDRTEAAVALSPLLTWPVTIYRRQLSDELLALFD
jgi:hypothetical protein